MKFEILTFFGSLVYIHLLLSLSIDYFIVFYLLLLHLLSLLVKVFVLVVLIVVVVVVGFCVLTLDPNPKWFLIIVSWASTYWDYASAP